MAMTATRSLRPMVAGVRNRWPTVGLAVGVVRDGAMERFAADGLADIAANTPVTPDTVFRIASITKTFTAVAVLQLWERGLVDLDAPANRYLRGYQLVPARASFRPATVRHLLTHTAGIREVLHPWGLLRPRDLGETVPLGRAVPALAEYYRGGLRLDADPGTRFTYSNHGFATLGQLVEDVSGMPLDRYLRERLFEPLGMADTDLVRTERASPRRATGYELRAAGPRPVPDYEVITAGGGAAWSTPADMARYAAALLGGGAGEHGAVLRPGTVAAMFAPQYQPDPRIPGFGLGFFRTGVGGHRAVEHDGILPGFDAQLLLAPGDGVGVLAFANGARRGMHWLGPEAGGLLRRLLDIPDEAIRSDVPHRPELWGELCGRYRFLAHPSDPAWLAIGPRVEVVVRHGRLTLRALSPIPALRRGFLLHPDDAHDPYVFRIELPWFGIGTGRVVFSPEPGVRATALHLEFAPLSSSGNHPEDDGLEATGMAIERLTAEDQLMLAASGRWPQDIGALALLDGGCLLDAAGQLRIDAVRAAIRSRLHLAPRFRQVVQVPGRGLGPPLWVDDPAFDLDDHVRVLPVPAPGGEAELLAAVERLRRRPLERSRPLWQLWFLTGLAEGRVGLYVKLHHAVADGMATMATMARFLDPVADPPAAQPPPWAPAPGPTAAALLADNLLRHLRRISGALATFTRPRAALRRLRRAWPATREVLVGAPPPATSLDRLVGPDRSLALVRTSLDQVREIAHGNDATVNDVLLALTADGLRALLQRRGEPVEDTNVRIWVPVSLRRRGPDAPGDHPGPLQGNLVAQMVVPLPLGGPHPGRRLRRIAAETALRKARVRSSLGTLFGGRVMRRLLLPAVIRQRVNVTSASIPGPTGPRYLAGARVLEVFPVLPLIGNVTLGVGALSYAGTFTIGVVADRAAYPDLEVFAAAVRAALRRQEVPA